MQSSFSVKAENLVNTFNFTPSAPIPIINSNPKCNSSYDNLKDESDLTNDEYILNSNIFNPSKMSPPNEWKNRLKNRIRIYFSSDSDLNIEKYK
tara:strand:- start:151 stop:432 length:282 start_codon:yes stop_codon:yes gene_type:complete